MKHDHFLKRLGLGVVTLIFVLLAAGPQSPPPQAGPASHLRFLARGGGALSTNVEGQLSKDDEVFADRYADRYDLDLSRFEATGEALLVMSSDAFLPHLYLLDAKTGKVLAESNDATLGKDARAKDHGPSALIWMSFSLPE